MSAIYCMCVLMRDVHLRDIVLTTHVCPYNSRIPLVCLNQYHTRNKYQLLIRDCAFGNEWFRSDCMRSIIHGVLDEVCKHEKLKLPLHMESVLNPHQFW